MSVDGNKLLNLAGAQILYNNLREILDTKLNNSLKGTPNGLAELDSSGKVPASQLPSYVDDVVEFTRLSNFPVPGQSGKIYVALDTNLTYRWSGTSYVQISSALALGETSTTAYRGDRGALAYNHANSKGSAFSSGMYKITTNSQGHVTNAIPVVKQDITKLGILDAVPTKTSELINDSGFITDFVEIDPTVPAWAKATTKPTYTAAEVGALPNTTTIPTKVSQLTNDAGYLTAHQDISGKADKSELPKKVSDLTNDVGFITEYTETDPTVPAWAKAATKPSYTANEVGALPSTTVIPSKTSDLQNDSNFVDENQLEQLIIIQEEQPESENNKIWIQDNRTNVQIPTMEDIPTKISDLTNDAGYYTKPSGGIPASDLAESYFKTGDYAISSEVKSGAGTNKVLTPNYQHHSVFFGLAKAAGDTTQTASANAVGTYTDQAKAAIQTMLNVPDIADTVSDVQTNGTSIVVNGVANIPLAGFSTYGVVKVDPNMGVRLTAYDRLAINEASPTHAKEGASLYFPITPGRQHMSTFYGLAKAAGDTTQAQSDNEIGTYTDQAKAAIRSMLGAVGDTEYATTSSAGVVKVNQSYGILIDDGTLKINSVNTSIKTAVNPNIPVVCSNEHMAVFYGLAKAAGDSTQSSSANAVGVYTDEAKDAIKEMLDVGTITETISSTAPTITAKANHRYICGEVTSLSFTPCANGICDVRFTSGLSVTALTVPSNVQWPDWFDPTELVTNTVYELNIVDGIYGVVGTWAT